jgi:hypothetical protein
MKITYALGAAGLGLLVTAAGTTLAMRAGQLAEVRRIRRDLEQRRRGAAERFREEMVADLPEPALRYLLHAIRPGTELADTVELGMAGEIRLKPGGPWLPLRARETLSPPDGFLWEATAGRVLMRFSGADAYAHGRSHTAFRLWDLVPVAQARGPDVARSARGRLAGEAVWNPAALLPQRGVTWEALDERTARATLALDGESIPLTLTIEPDRRLRSVTLPRWGDPTDNGRHALIPFGMDVLEERTFDGYTIPSRIAGGWWYGTDRFFDFFHAAIQQASFR